MGSSAHLPVVFGHRSPPFAGDTGTDCPDSRWTGNKADELPLTFNHMAWDSYLHIKPLRFDKFNTLKRNTEISFVGRYA